MQACGGKGESGSRAGSRGLQGSGRPGTQRAPFCVEALEDALARYDMAEIFNTDQGSQFTSADFIEVLKNKKIQISMDGTGAWRDKVFVERLWKSIKYEEVY